MDFLNNANTIASLILAFFGIGGYAIAIVGYLRGKASVGQKSSNSATQKPSTPFQWIHANSSLSWLDWMEVIASGSFDFITLGNPDSNEPNGCLVPFISALVSGGVLLFFALIFWTFGVVDVWRPAWFVAALVFITIVLATWVYFVGRRVEEKATMTQKSSLY